MVSRVRSLVADSSRVILSDRLQTRIVSTGASTTLVFSILNTGTIDGPVDPAEREGDWEFTLFAADTCPFELDLVITREDTLFIKTLRQKLAPGIQAAGL